MNGLPEPYTLTQRVVVRGKQYVIMDRAPNSDGWRYRGTPVDLAGSSIWFSHDEALPVGPTPPRRVPADYDDLVERHDPLGDVLDAIAAEIRAGLATPRLHGAYVTFMEAGA